MIWTWKSILLVSPGFRWRKWVWGSQTLQTRCEEIQLDSKKLILLQYLFVFCFVFLHSAVFWTISSKNQFFYSKTIVIAVNVAYMRIIFQTRQYCCLLFLQDILIHLPLELLWVFWLFFVANIIHGVLQRFDAKSPRFTLYIYDYTCVS